jgi:hypothetical protein
MRFDHAGDQRRPGQVDHLRIGGRIDLRARSDRLNAIPLASSWTAERAEEWWATHRPAPSDARSVADVLLSQEVREVRVRPH